MLLLPPRLQRELQARSDTCIVIAKDLAIIPPNSESRTLVAKFIERQANQLD